MPLTLSGKKIIYGSNKMFHEFLSIHMSCMNYQFISSIIQFNSVAQLCPTRSNPVDCSMPGFPVHYQILQAAQTQVHRVGDAIHPSHPLSSPSPASVFPSIRASSNESVFHTRCQFFTSYLLLRYLIVFIYFF